MEYKKAKTCKHAVQLTEHGGLFVKESCVADNKLHLPCPTKTGKSVKRPYIMAKYCNTCKGYSATKTKEEATSKKKMIKGTKKVTKGRVKKK